MKKMLTMLLALMMALTMLPAMADGLYEQMPDEIAALFDVPAWKEYEVLNWIYSDEMNAGVVVMTNGSLHVVCIVEPNSKGEMRITQRNYKMVVGDGGAYLGTGYGNTAQEIELPWGYHQMFELNTGSYLIAFGKFDGVWRVKVVLNNEAERLSFVFDDRIGYREGEDKEEYIDWDHNKMHYAYGVYDNRFSAFNIHDFPKSLEEAREKLTNPPVTPTDFYNPETVTLRANEKYDVFSAPGRDSYRAANGKAVMSTNDWVQIFGEEDGWLLVQYDISADRMRFGYIDASALPKDTQVQSLTWYDLPEQTLKCNISVTDDPLASGASICMLSMGDKVRVLSSFDNWYYIETNDGYGNLLRGFVPKGCIDIVSEDDMVG